MSDRTWTVDVDISTIVRRTITVPVRCNSRVDAEAQAAAAVRQLEHDELPPGLRAISWKVDKATATEVPS